MTLDKFEENLRMFAQVIGEDAGQKGMQLRVHKQPKNVYVFDFSGFHPEHGPIQMVYTVWYNTEHKTAMYKQGVFQQRPERVIN